MMKLAIMQPYLFPYLGYFQLIHNVDFFVFLDDAAFIKQGWINRNRIWVGGRPIYFTVPLTGASSYASIKQTRIHPGLYSRWRRRFFCTLEQYYGKAPRFSDTSALVRAILSGSPDAIASLAIDSVEQCTRFMGIASKFGISSRDFPNKQGLSGAERVKEICREAGAKTYVNSAGGIHLYDPKDFAADGLDLVFLRPRKGHPLLQEPMLSELSILHTLMYLAPEGLRSVLNEFELR